MKEPTRSNLGGRNLPAHKNLFAAAIAIALFINQSVPASSWRLFDGQETHILGALQPALNNPFEMAPQFGLPSSSQPGGQLFSALIGNQHLQPSEGQQPESSGGADSQLLAKSAAQQVVDSSRFLDSLLAPTVNAVGQESLPGAGKQLEQPGGVDVARDASSLISSAVSSVVGDLKQLALNASSESSANSASTNQSTASSTIGQIILNELVGRSNSSASASASASSAGSEKLSASIQAAQQLFKLKPKRQSSQSISAQAEQAIINQHARAHHQHHYSPSQHQRLLATKHRSHKLDSASDGRDSALAAVLDNLKSGISSRSSIVKAISDNKLARKLSALSTVGKSIGGNKYIASAAALAALGLTVSKLLSPYLFAGSYSKLGEPMMSSGSLLSPSYSTLTYLSPPSSRNNFGGSYESAPLPSDSMLSLASSSPLVRSQSAGFPFVAELSGSEQTNDESSLLQQQLLQQLQQQQQQQQQQAYSSPQSTHNEELYLKYTPLRPSRSSGPFKPMRGKLNAPNSDTDGLYTNFYNQQGMSSPETSSASSYEPNAAANYPSVAFEGNHNFSPQSAAFEGGNSMQVANELHSQPTSGQSFDQIIPSSSFDQPTYTRQLLGYPDQFNGPYLSAANLQPAGSASLQMDGSSRTQVNQQLGHPVAKFEGSQQVFGANKWPTLHPFVAKSSDPIAASSDQRQYASSPTRSVGDYHYHAPSVLLGGGGGHNNHQQQQQLMGEKVASTSTLDSAAKHLQIRLKSSSPKVAHSSGELSRQSASAAGAGQEQPTGEPWKSLGGASSSLESLSNQTANWQMMAASKQQQQHFQQRQLTNEQQQQQQQVEQRFASISAPSRDLAQQHELQLLHRVSRTPAKSSVKASSSVLPPAESLTDSKPPSGAEADGINSLATSSESIMTPVHGRASKQSQLRLLGAQTKDRTGQWQASRAQQTLELAPAMSDSGELNQDDNANLEGDKNDAIKVIEAKTNSQAEEQQIEAGGQRAAQSGGGKLTANYEDDSNKLMLILAASRAAGQQYNGLEERQHHRLGQADKLPAPTPAPKSSYNTTAKEEAGATQSDDSDTLRAFTGLARGSIGSAD